MILAEDALMEAAHRLDIGFTVYDWDGRKYQKTT